MRTRTPERGIVEQGHGQLRRADQSEKCNAGDDVVAGQRPVEERRRGQQRQQHAERAVEPQARR